MNKAQYLNELQAVAMLHQNDIVNREEKSRLIVLAKQSTTKPEAINDFLAELYRLRSQVDQNRQEIIDLAIDEVVMQ